MGSSKKRKEQRKLLQSQSTEGANDGYEQVAVTHVDTTRTPSEKEMTEAASTKAICLEDNPQIKLQGVQGKGRGLFWCPSDGKILLRGITLMRLQPEVMVPDEEHITGCCHVCYAHKSTKGGSFHSCSTCELVHYCSQACKDVDQDLHQEECKALVAYKTNYGKADPGSSLRKMARLLWQRKVMGEKGEDWWKKITSLLVHHDETKNISSHNRAAHALADFLCGTRLVNNKDIELAKLGYPSLQELQALSARLEYSALYAHDAYQQRIGAVLSTTGAMMNHSCTPNSTIVWPKGPGVNKPMHIVNLLPLKAGDEITITYSDPAMPYAMRQTDLQKHWLFKCECSACTRDQQAREGKISFVDARQSLLCGRKDCKGMVAFHWESSMPKGVCTGCGEPCTFSGTKVASIIALSKKMLAKVSRCADKEAVDILLKDAKIMKDLTSIQPPSSFPLNALLNRFWEPLLHFANDFGQRGNLDELANYGQESIRMALLILEGSHASDDNYLAPEGDAARIRILIQQFGSVMRHAYIDPDNGEKSPFLTFPPYIPPAGKEKIDFGEKLFSQALKEIRIGFGEDAAECKMLACLTDGREAAMKNVRIEQSKEQTSSVLGGLSRLQQP